MIFDAYLMVDWSANSKPKTGKDSIWCGLLRRFENGLGPVWLENPPTRAEARDLIVHRLRHLLNAGAKVLVGFDFPYGYPGGTGTALRLGQVDALWQQIWRVLSGCIKDDADNKNNRYAVAAALNKCLSNSPFPFWGCPPTSTCPFLLPNKIPTPPGYEVAEYRMTERQVPGPQPAWKLAYAGSVGSQALLGIPVLDAIRHDPHLAPVSRVWPFETGPHHGETVTSDQCRIIHAEIYPSIIRRLQVPARMVKDAAQVAALARYFAKQDEENKLERSFEAPAALGPQDRSKIEQEEGWILGVPQQ